WAFSPFWPIKDFVPSVVALTSNGGAAPPSPPCAPPRHFLILQKKPRKNLSTPPSPTGVPPAPGPPPPPAPPPAPPPPRAPAAPRVGAVHGHFVSEALTGPECPPPVNLGTKGQFTGDIRGEFVFTATPLTPSADTPATGVLHYTGDIVIKTRRGQITIKDSGA